jgi:hypothetical protein
VTALPDHLQTRLLIVYEVSPAKYVSVWVPTGKALARVDSEIKVAKTDVNRVRLVKRKQRRKYS